MKKLMMAMAVAALALTACNKTEQKAEADAAAQEAAQTENLVGQIPAGSVKDCTDDNYWRPGVKVDTPVVLDFNATWCGPCKQLKPAFDRAAAQFADTRFVSIDIDRNPQTAAAFNIQAVPTVVFLYPDGTSKEYVGTDELLPYEKLEALLAAK